MTVQPARQQTLPTGVVTFLFTDISGSSQLWEKFGDRFIPVWQAHDAVLRDAFARFGGVEIKSEGDSFMVAFSDPADALECALFAQSALTRYPWPTDIGAPRVRVGLHTGEPFLYGNDYFGPVVNRAAHICTAAHGGQVLLSDDTRKAVKDRIAPHIHLKDMGELRLKDMGKPQRLHEAQDPAADARLFPPPRTLDSQPHNLPEQRTTFVGRAKEIEQIVSFLVSGEKPVLTVTGPGGIGKTRLSLQAAAARAEWFPDGVWCVRLVEAKDVTGAAIEIATAMNIPIRPPTSPLNAVRQWLSDRHCLLILDDAGSIPQADALIRELLEGTTNLRCIATSRESLHIAEAEDLPLTGLATTPETSGVEAVNDPLALAPTAGAVPRSESEAPDPLLETDAGRLFLERASQVRPDLKLTPRDKEVVGELLQKLEGIPVNIEQVAKLMESYSPTVILEWLNRKLEPNRIPSKESNVEKFKGIMRRGAQRVSESVEELPKALAVNLSHLLQNVASIAADRHNEKEATELGRESLRLSHQVGDELGMASALRQLARSRWQQGDHKSAVAMLSAAVQLYRTHEAEELAVTQRELETYRERLAQHEKSLPLTPSVEGAMDIAMNDIASNQEA